MMSTRIIVLVFVCLSPNSTNSLLYPFPKEVTPLRLAPPRPRVLVGDTSSTI